MLKSRKSWEYPFQGQENECGIDSGWSLQPSDLIPVAVNLEKGSHNFLAIYSLDNAFHFKSILPWY